MVGELQPHFWCWLNLRKQYPHWDTNSLPGVTLSQIGYANTRMSYTVNKHPGGFVITCKTTMATVFYSLVLTIPGLGSVIGEYTNRDIIQLEIGMTFGRSKGG